MKTEVKNLKIEGETVSCEVDIFEEEDLDHIRQIYDDWKDLAFNLNLINCRKPNFPEISEVIYCYIFNCWRTNNLKSISNKSSFDCYNPKTEKRIEIKSTSIKNDLTSFSPKTLWDELYFLDFYTGKRIY